MSPRLPSVIQRVVSGSYLVTLSPLSRLQAGSEGWTSREVEERRSGGGGGLNTDQRLNAEGATHSGRTRGRGNEEEEGKENGDGGGGRSSSGAGQTGQGSQRLDDASSKLKTFARLTRNTDQYVQLRQQHLCYYTFILIKNNIY